MSKSPPKVPVPFKTLKDYKIPSNIRDELELPAYLFTDELEKWGDSSEILKSYFDLRVAVPNTGYQILDNVSSALVKLKAHKDILVSIQKYCARLENYFKKKIVKDQFIATYNLKEQEWRERRSQDNLNLETRKSS